MPSSKGPGVPLMYTMANNIKKHVGKASVEELLVRKFPMGTKTTDMEDARRKTPGAAGEIQFPTLVLNDKYKQVRYHHMLLW